MNKNEELVEKVMEKGRIEFGPQQECCGNYFYYCTCYMSDHIQENLKKGSGGFPISKANELRDIRLKEVITKDINKELFDKNNIKVVKSELDKEMVFFVETDIYLDDLYKMFNKTNTFKYYSNLIRITFRK